MTLRGRRNQSSAGIVRPYSFWRDRSRLKKSRDGVSHIAREYHADPFEQTWVRDVMVHEVETLPWNMSVSDGNLFFTSTTHRHKNYPIVDVGRRVVGMVSRGDILAWINERDENDPMTSIADALSETEVVTGHPDEIVSELADRMASAEVGRVPIIDSDGRLVGLAARKDLLAARARKRAEESDRSLMLKARWRPDRRPESNA
jgi:CIC family chloride channel protein